MAHKPASPGDVAKVINNIVTTKDSSKIVDENGEPLVVYHGGMFGQPSEEINLLIDSRSPYTWDADGAGGWFSSNSDYSEGYMPNGGKPIKVFLDIKKPFDMGDTFRLIVKDGKPTRLLHEIAQKLNVEDKVILDMADRDFANDWDGKEIPLYAINRTNAFVDLLKKNGYDGAHDIEYDGKTDAYMVVDPNQIKSADPVTRDDAGNVIPLSERFNEGKDDIRFSTGNSEIATHIYGLNSKHKLIGTAIT